MTTLTLIADAFPDWEARVQVAAAQDLTRAVAAVAPRSCSVRYLAARDTEKPEFASAKIRVDQVPIPVSMLPYFWQAGATARLLDGEFVHSLTPLVPLRSRGEDDGSQSSVTIPHAVAWENPAILGPSLSRLFRTFARRAIKHADVIVTPTHATAEVLQQYYGADLQVQVLPLAAPSEYLAGPDAGVRRAELGLPEHYVLTTASNDEFGRLEWLFEAMRTDPTLPPLVVLDGLDVSRPARGTRDDDAEQQTIPADLEGRVVTVEPDALSDIGAVLAGASLLAQPQSYSGTGYTVLGALAAGVPVLHADQRATSELVLDAGIAAGESGDFVAELTRLFSDEQTLQQLSVLATDRGRSFSWRSAAWQLWETHANV